MRIALLTLLLAAPAGYPAVAQFKDERIEPSPKELTKLQELTRAHFAATAIVKDDDLEALAEISTVEGYASNGRFTDRVRSDNFLRAFVSKGRGAVKYQLYQTITYTGEWRTFTRVNYATPSGLKAADLTVLKREVGTCAYGLCVYTEAVGFDVSEDDLRAIATQYVPGSSTFWRFRFKARNGIDWEDRMMPAEVAGLLQAVDQYRAEHVPAANKPLSDGGPSSSIPPQ